MQMRRDAYTYRYVRLVMLRKSRQCPGARRKPSYYPIRSANWLLLSRIQRSRANIRRFSRLRLYSTSNRIGEAIYNFTLCISSNGKQGNSLTPALLSREQMRSRGLRRFMASVTRCLKFLYRWSLINISCVIVYLKKHNKISCQFNRLHYIAIWLQDVKHRYYLWCEVTERAEHKKFTTLEKSGISFEHIWQLQNMATTS